MTGPTAVRYRTLPQFDHYRKFMNFSADNRRDGGIWPALTAIDGPRGGSLRPVQRLLRQDCRARTGRSPPGRRGAWVHAARLPALGAWVRLRFVLANPPVNMRSSDYQQQRAGAAVSALRRRAGIGWGRQPFPARERLWRRSRYLMLLASRVPAFTFDQL